MPEGNPWDMADEMAWRPGAALDDVRTSAAQSGQPWRA
jgi:hypothetical protein